MNTSMSQTIRSACVALVGIVALAFAGRQLVESPGYRIPKDFPEYWAAGRLNLRGNNPYSPGELLREQRSIDPNRDEALMMWNPPPALSLYMPLGLLAARPAALIWVGLQLLAVMLSCDLLWRQYCPNGKRGLAQQLAISFVGVWWMVVYGQNSGLLLFGLAGFLHFSEKNKLLAAGACAALTALKPHLLAGFGILLLADLVAKRGRLVFAAGASVIALSLGIALCANPQALEQYVAATGNPGPGAIPLQGWALPVPAYWLRMAIAGDAFWLQFLPCAIVCAGLLLWRAKRGQRWNWPAALPWVVAASVLASPYGWIFDLPVLLVPVVSAASRLARSDRWLSFAAFVLAQSLVTIASMVFVAGLHEYWWVAPAVLAPCSLAFFVGDPAVRATLSTQEPARPSIAN